jgi:uncharacterized protein (DUF4415 family)
LIGNAIHVFGKILSLSNLRFLLLLLLFFSLPSCRPSSEERYKTVFSEANRIGNQQTKVMNQWAREFGPVFTAQNRAQFPSNRDWLNSRAQKIIPLIDASLRLSNEAIEKYEEAGRLMSNDQHKKGLSLMVASFRKSIEIEQMFKAQAQLASDETITDAKTFNEKFSHFDELIRQKQKEHDDQFDEGRRLMVVQ